MLYKELSSENYTADDWNKYMSHYSQEGRWIKGTCNFVAEKVLEERQWMDKNDADSELENADKLIYIPHCLVAVCSGM
jgi:hypothetical protein